MTDPNGAPPPATFTDDYDRIMQLVADLPDVQELKPKTIMQSPNPLSVDRSIDYTVHLAKMSDPIDGTRLTAFVRAQRGHEGIRLVLPNKVIEEIVRQRDRLYDRATPASRKRARRKTELTRKRKRDHKAGRHTGVRSNGKAKRVAACLLCKPTNTVDLIGALVESAPDG